MSGQETASVTNCVPCENPVQKWGSSLSIHEAILEAKKKAESQADKFERAKPKPRYADASFEAYLRIGRARTPMQAGSAAGFARGKIAQLQMAKGRDKDNARQIQAVIGQLRKAVLRASKKKTELTQDQLTEIRREKLEKQKEFRKGKRLRYQLTSRRSLRAIRESGYFRELDIENRQQAFMTSTEMKLREQAQSLYESAASLSVESAIGRYTAQSEAVIPEANANISIQA